MPDAVDDARVAVSFDYYARQPSGEQLPQSSAPEIIAAKLRLLGVRPGMRVLEVGAGSGYSTALLAHPVGLSGKVVSLDVDAALTARAADLLERAGCGQVTVVALLSVRTAHYVEAGERAAAETLRRWVAQWRAAGRPGFDQVQLRTARQAHGWRVQATMPTRQSQG